MRALAIALVLLAAACGGSKEPAPSEPAPAPAPTEEAKLRAAQDATMAAMCERLVDCSVEDAKATITEAELAELAPEELVPKARAECEGEYASLTLSPRQIKVIQGCVNGPPACADFTACLDAANKQPAPTGAALAP
jgi:hypothetical protein